MRFRERLYMFMQGRYGNDRFSRFLVWTSLILIIISYISGLTLVYWLSVALFIYGGIFRVMSRNIPARTRENNRYLMMSGKVKNALGRFFGASHAGYSSNGTYCDPGYKIFKCPCCGQKLRVPRKRGKIEINCRRCGSTFRKRT